MGVSRSTNPNSGAFRVCMFKIAIAAGVLSLLGIIWTPALADCSSVTSAATSSDIPPSCIENPFPTDASVAAFRDYVRQRSVDLGQPIEIPEAFYKAAKLITYWGYEFQRNSAGTYDVFFVQRYNATEVATTLLAQIGAVKDSGCSFFHAVNPQMASISRLAIVGVAGIEGKVRKCWWFFGDQNSDVGDIGGSVTGTMTYRIDPMPDGDDKRFKGSFLANAPTVLVAPKADSVLGFNSSSVVGQLLTALDHLGSAPFALVKNPTDSSVWEGLNIFDGGILRNQVDPVLAVDFATERKGLIYASQFKTFLRQIDEGLWAIKPGFRISDARSGFSGIGTNLVLDVVYVATLQRNWPVKTVKADCDREIQLLRSFSQTTQSITPPRGATLWSISTKYYGTPYFFQMLASANGMDRETVNHIRVNKPLLIPPLYQLAASDSYHFLAPGETLWALCKSRMPKTMERCLKEFQGANPHLALSKVYALEGIRLPVNSARTTN
jgi:hypothetical protein